MIRFQRHIGFVLLALYSVVLLHNLVSHEHDDEHCPDLHVETTCSHSHEHEHHFHSEHSSWMTSLLGMFENCDHTGQCVGHAENYLLVKPGQNIKVPDAIFTYGFIAYLSFPALNGFEIESKIIKDGIIVPPDLRYNQPEFSIDPMRGPPALA